MKNTLPAVGSNRLLDSGGSRSGSTSGTRVVHVLSGEPYDIYIGRAMPRFGLKASKWQNPFKLRDYDDPTKCLQDYKEHLLSHPEILNDLWELRGKVLGCWCKSRKNPDAPCHGDILVEMLDTLVDLTTIRI